MVTTSRWRSFRCRVLRMHYRKTMSTPDGERYLACAVCRTEHPGPGHWLAPGMANGIGGI